MVPFGSVEWALMAKRPDPDPEGATLPTHDSDVSSHRQRAALAQRPRPLGLTPMKRPHPPKATTPQRTKHPATRSASPSAMAEVGDAAGAPWTATAPTAAAEAHVSSQSHPVGPLPQPAAEASANIRSQTRDNS